MLILKFKDTNEQYRVCGMLSQDIRNYAYDNCHKHYIIRNNKEMEEAKSYGYDIKPLCELPSTWSNSCGLEMIDFWDVENIVCPVLIMQCVQDHVNIYNNELDTVIEVDSRDNIAIIIDGMDCDNFEYFLNEHILETIH